MIYMLWTIWFHVIFFLPLSYFFLFCLWFSHTDLNCGFAKCKKLCIIFVLLAIIIYTYNNKFRNNSQQPVLGECMKWKLNLIAIKINTLKNFQKSLKPKLLIFTVLRCRRITEILLYACISTDIHPQISISPSLYWLSIINICLQKQHLLPLPFLYKFPSHWHK